MYFIKTLLLGLSSAFLFTQCEKSEIKTYNSGINITPKPLSLQTKEGQFELSQDTHFVTDGNPVLNHTGKFYANKIANATGIQIEINSINHSNQTIHLSIDSTLSLNEEGYNLKVDNKSIRIVGKSAKGVFYGLNTLMQLLPAEIESHSLQPQTKWIIPAVTITDQPRFPWRGFHLDVSRHFISIKEVKKHLDMLAVFKINKFHWHLTDDQGWRIEIKKHPKLTEVGATRTEANGTTHEGFYTQEEVKEVVAYAAERQIDVIPEIEMPGHALAAISALPELSCTGLQYSPRIIWGVEREVFCAGKESTFHFLEEVIEEITPLFPYEYYHLGGDECPKERWEACPSCQSRMKSEKLQNVQELQSYFMQRMEKVLRSKNKKMIGWDEILEGGISKTTNIMSWRGEEGGIAAANAGNDVIMTPGQWLYLDKYEGDKKIGPVTIGGHLPLKTVYNYEPIPSEIDSSKVHHVLGAQTALWSEYIYQEVQSEYRLYPRAIALAELAWSSIENKDYDDFERRLNNQMVRMDGHEIDYYIPLPEGASNHVVLLDSVRLVLNTPRPVHHMVYTTDGTPPSTQSSVYHEPLVFTKNTTLKIASVLSHGKMSRIRTIKVEQQKLEKSIVVRSTKKGLRTKTAYGQFIHTDNLSKIKDWEIGSIDSIAQANQALHWGHEIDPERFRAVIMEGYIDISEDGIYHFSSDQDQVWIDDELVINNDNFVKRFSQNDGAKALKKGLHKLKIIYLNNIYGGWASDWSILALNIKKSTDQEFKRVTKEQLYY